jgi:hypothetical protein
MMHYPNCSILFLIAVAYLRPFPATPHVYFVEASSRGGYITPRFGALPLGIFVWCPIFVPVPWMAWISIDGMLILVSVLELSCSNGDWLCTMHILRYYLAMVLSSSGVSSASMVDDMCYRCWLLSVVPVVMASTNESHGHSMTPVRYNQTIHLMLSTSTDTIWPRWWEMNSSPDQYHIPVWQWYRRFCNRAPP